MPSEPKNKLLRELEAELQALEARSQRRSLIEIHGINLCSNDYLGLSRSPLLKDEVIAAIRNADRVGSTGSRLLSGHAGIWSEVEAEFAQYAGTEAALFFGSGYSANLGLISSLISRDDVVFSDTLNHASIIDGIRLSGARKFIYPHLDLNALEAVLRSHAGERCRKIIVTETVFSMDGDVAPVAHIQSLAEKYGAELIVDEAHATGVHGPAGRGIAAQAGIAEKVFAVVHTCGKALASAGAFVCGSKILKEHLINRARTFIFSTALPPYLAGQIRAALRISLLMNQERAALQMNSANLESAMRAMGLDTAGSTSQIVPAVIGGNEDALGASEFLRREGFAVRAIRPPTVAEGTARLRFSLTAAISSTDVARLETVLQNWRASLPQTHALAGRA
ncbi:MAG TPA: 8-amino-7-oxononanoate synthase [Candidatus Saccharimonadales bacterium]|nr:8-amino-7-oxononanoate synthase [Candidatus Saccharimonadales bacterium]